MKKYIIISAFCCLPTATLGLVVPIIVLFSGKGIHFNEIVLLWYMGILLVSISIIMSTILMLQRYASKIDHLDEAEMETYKERQRLLNVITKYNQLIANEQHSN